MKKFTDGILAGLMISIGGAAFLMCYEQHRVVGAFLFCIGLLTVCWKGFSLYTGKIGLLWDRHSKDDILVLAIGLLGNAVATVICGYLLALAIPSLRETATVICQAKLQQGLGSSFVRAVFCGILIYVAVDIYSNKNSVLGVILGIPAFILSGYEHSIADMFYFSSTVKGLAFAKVLPFLILIVLGNSVGGLVIPTIKKIGELSFAKRKSAVCAVAAEVAADEIKSSGEVATDDIENVDEAASDNK